MRILLGQGAVPAPSWLVSSFSLSVWTHRLLVSSLGYKPSLSLFILKLEPSWIGPLASGPCVLSTCPHHPQVASLISSTAWHSRSIMPFPCARSGLRSAPDAVSPWSVSEQRDEGAAYGCLPTTSPSSPPDTTRSHPIILYSMLVALLSNQETPGCVDSQLIYFFTQAYHIHIVSALLPQATAENKTLD